MSTEKKIVDYLYLYGLGLEVRFDNKTWKINRFGKDIVRLTLKSDSSRWVEAYYSNLIVPLSKLEDMTSEELQECGNMEYDFSDEPELNNHKPEDFYLCSSAQFHYLLKKGYDLFGLIEAGLAVDKKTLK